MTSRWVSALAAVVATVVVGSVVVGLTSPNGSAGDDRDASDVRPAATSPSSASSTAPDRQPSAARAPASVARTWAGRPASTRLRGSRVDWCPAVRTTGDAEARQVFGDRATDSAACTAVSFVLDRRYSRVSLPRRTYTARDLSFVLPALTEQTAATYRTRIDRFVAAPAVGDAREALGLVLLRGSGTATGGHVAAGEGRVFYGPGLTRGYRGRSVWINPRFSAVEVRVDRTRTQPRIVASFTASAAVPVFDPSRRRDDMMTVPTRAQLILRQTDDGWRIAGWDALSGGPATYARLAVH